MSDDNAFALEPHDVLAIPMQGKSWVVTGVFLGALRQESVIGLQVSGEHQDATARGKSLPELFVPEILIETAIKAGVVRLHKAEA